MTELTVRRLLIDLEAPPARHWCDGDAFRTAFYNALSMSFPVGEQFFIDAVRNAVALLPPAEQAARRAEVQGFVGQEATHRRIHGLFNRHLADQGLEDRWTARILSRQRRLEGADPRHALAATAAYEHFTAILAEWMLANADSLAGCEPRLARMWLWHAAEESEHKSVAFDLYRAVGGNLAWRRRWFCVATVLFTVDVVRQTAHNLRRDGTLWRRSTWASGWRWLLGRGGLVRAVAAPWRAYLRADFHPEQQATPRAADWLAGNAEAWQPVGGARG